MLLSSLKIRLGVVAMIKICNKLIGNTPVDDVEKRKEDFNERKKNPSEYFSLHNLYFFSFHAKA